MARYIDSDQFINRFIGLGTSRDSTGRQTHLSGKRVIELGAGTGVVGIMAGYLGATAYITDYDSLVPLMAYNIERNQVLLDNGTGKVTARALCWGTQHFDLTNDILAPDFLVLANCIYYESSLEPLLDTVLALTVNGTAKTVLLACYEERTKEIRGLVSRWHELIGHYFTIEDIPSDQYDVRFKQDYVRLVIMMPKITYLNVYTTSTSNSLKL